MAIDLSQIDVETFLKELGINNVRDDGREVKYSCFSDAHYRGDANPSASMEKGSTVFYCFSCGMSGNAISFLATLENVSPVQAAIWIKDRFGGGFDIPEQGKIADSIKQILDKEEVKKEYRKTEFLSEQEVDRRKINWKKIYKEYLQYKSPMLEKLPGKTFEDIFQPQEKSYKNEFYMLERGFSSDILNKYQIGWDKISERFTIPVRDKEGRLLGFKARAIERDPKYLVLGGPEYGFEPYETSKVIFGLDKIDFQKNADLIICEGELNAIAMQQNGFKNTTGISGKILSDEQANIVTKNAEKVLLIFDEEEDAERAANKLKEFIPAFIAPPHTKDPADMNKDEIVSLVAGRRTALLKYKDEQ